jgi:hypothetical protein
MGSAPVITSNAFGSSGSKAVIILGADNSLKFSSYLESLAKPVFNQDFYMLSTNVSTLPAVTSGSSTGGLRLVRINRNGVIVNSRNISYSKLSAASASKNNYVINTAPNGDVIIGALHTGMVQVFSEDLSVEKLNIPVNWATATLNAYPDGRFENIEIDHLGRLHFILRNVANTSQILNPKNLPNLSTTKGALQSASELPHSVGLYYAIVDCTTDDVVYSTFIRGQAPEIAANASWGFYIPYSFNVEGSTMHHLYGA